MKNRSLRKLRFYAISVNQQLNKLLILKFFIQPENGQIV